MELNDVGPFSTTSAVGWSREWDSGLMESTYNSQRDTFSRKELLCVMLKFILCTVPLFHNRGCKMKKQKETELELELGAAL